LLSNQTAPCIAPRTTVTIVSAESFDPHTLIESPFGCAVHRRGRSSEIVLEGELDLAAKPVLEDSIATALRHGSVETLIIDMTRVTFADSTTMTWLVRVNTRTDAAGGRLVVIAGPGPVLDVLHMTGIDERVTVVAEDRMR
jgi:anti-sigma B factor antagonist